MHAGYHCSRGLLCSHYHFGVRIETFWFLQAGGFHDSVENYDTDHTSCYNYSKLLWKKIDSSLLSLGLLALFCGVIYLVVGFLVEKKSGKDAQAFHMLNLTGYHIGTFVIPFAQSFLGPMGVIAASLFDTGNSAICLGGAYSLASMVKDGCG